MKKEIEAHATLTSTKIYNIEFNINLDGKETFFKRIKVSSNRLVCSNCNKAINEGNVDYIINQIDMDNTGNISISYDKDKFFCSDECLIASKL